jgi:hypothetical protein
VVSRLELIDPLNLALEIGFYVNKGSSYLLRKFFAGRGIESASHLARR